MIKINCKFLVFLTFAGFIFQANAQLVSKTTLSNEEPIKTIIRVSDGFVALSQNDLLHGLRLIKLDDAQNTVWVKEYSTIHNWLPGFLKSTSNSELIFGGTTDTASIIFNTDSMGNLLEQFLFPDSFIVNDAIKMSSGSYYLQISKMFDHIGFGPLIETGVALMDTAGQIIWSHMSQNLTWNNRPIELIESYLNEVFSISDQGGLNYDYFNIVKETVSGSNILKHGFQMLYGTSDDHVIRLKNTTFLASCFSGYNPPPPFFNYLITLNPAGNYNTSRAIQFKDSSNFDRALFNIRCIESDDSCWICTGLTPGRLHWFKMSPAFQMKWSYAMDNASDLINSIVKSTDNGFLILTYKYGTLTNELITCDSLGMSTCPQITVPYTIFSETLNDNLNPHTQIVSMNSLSTTVSSSAGSYILNDKCISTNVSRLLTEESISIFPNPAFDKIYVINNCEAKAYKIFNSLGLEVATGNLGGQTEIDLTNFNEGVYLLLTNRGNALRILHFRK